MAFVCYDKYSNTLSRRAEIGLLERQRTADLSHGAVNLVVDQRRPASVHTRKHARHRLAIAETCTVDASYLLDVDGQTAKQRRDIDFCFTHSKVGNQAGTDQAAGGALQITVDALSRRRECRANQCIVGDAGGRHLNDGCWSAHNIVDRFQSHSRAWTWTRTRARTGGRAWAWRWGWTWCRTWGWSWCWTWSGLGLTGARPETPSNEVRVTRLSNCTEVAGAIAEIEGVAIWRADGGKFVAVKAWLPAAACSVDIWKR